MRALLIILLCSTNLFASNYLDSLKSIIQSSTSSEVSKMKAFGDLAWELSHSLPDSSYSLALKELQIARKLKNNSKEIDAYNNLSIVCRIKGNYIQALEYLQKCQKRQEELNDTDGLGSTYNNIGVIFQYQQDWKKALECADKGLYYYTLAKSKHGIANSITNKGIAYQGLKDFDKAIQEYQKNVTISEEMNNAQGLAYSYNNIGSAYYELMNLKEAKFYLEKSLVELKKINDPLAVAATLANLGVIYTKEGSATKGLNACIEALKLSKASSSVEEYRTSCHCLYEAYKSKGDKANALKYYEEFGLINDSIRNVKLLEDLTRKELNYSFDKKLLADSIKAEEEKLIHQTQIELHQAQLKQEKTTRYFILLVLALIVVFTFFLFNRFKKIRKQKVIIEKQKAEVEIQRSEALHLKALTEEKNKEITDSISYASRIQRAMLTGDKYIAEALDDVEQKNHFILFKPKDIVSGDFYWFYKDGDELWYFTGDCTGHGVPGGFMSTLGINLLNEIIIERGINDPGKVFNYMREDIIRSMNSEEGQGRDGMDGTLIKLNYSTGELKYACANNPIWIIVSNNQSEEAFVSAEDLKIIELKAQKMAIGFAEEFQPFKTQQRMCSKGDIIISFTDGFADQFGGTGGKKLKYRPMAELILNSSQYPLSQTKMLTDSYFEKWKGNNEQVDDVCVIGIRL